MSGDLAPSSDSDLSKPYGARVGVISDIHYSGDDITKFESQIETAVDHFDKSNTDLVVILGDAVIEGDEKETTIERLEIVARAFEDTNCPVQYVPGNHDVVNTDKQDLKAVFGEDAFNDTVSLTSHIDAVFLDTSAPHIPDSRGELGVDEAERLDKTLSESEYVVVFSHHPLYYHSLNDNPWFSEHPEVAFCSDKYRAQEVFENHGNILAAVNGHSHREHNDIYNDNPHFTIHPFGMESPESTGYNGSFAVIEVSRSRVKMISHKHGTFSDVSVVDYPAGDERVALGGTFDPVHDGHRQMFRRAFELGDVLVGLTSDELAPKTRHTERHVRRFTERKEALEKELDSIAETYDREFTVAELSEPMGEVVDNPEYTHLIVSPETFSRGEKLNTARLENGHEPLSLEVVTPILAEDGKRISSTRIRNGEIDEHGNILTD